jgi:predicted nuclease of restriction endonuclease-like (RecB) superfamily
MSNIQNSDFTNIVALIRESQGRVRQYTNTTLVNLYYTVGKMVSQKVAEGIWGQGTVDQLAEHIQAEIPTLKSFNRRGLYRMKQFYETYCNGSDFDVLMKSFLSVSDANDDDATTPVMPTQLPSEFVQSSLKQLIIPPNSKVSTALTQLENTENSAENEFVSPLVTQIAWASHLVIMSSCKSSEERLFYIIMCIKEKWAKRELIRQIESGYFERFLLSSANVSPVVTHLPVNANEHLRDIYALEFLELGDDFSESELQKSIIKNLKKFILEIGSNFSFVGEEYRVQVGGKDFEVDLLFYHRVLQCLVAFELKITDFKPEYIGKMNFYLEALDREHKQPHENPSIGVILCKSKDEEIVEIAMSRNLSPTKVAEYTTKLIDKKLLQNKLHELSELYQQNLEIKGGKN